MIETSRLILILGSTLTFLRLPKFTLTLKCNCLVFFVFVFIELNLLTVFDVIVRKDINDLLMTYVVITHCGIKTFNKTSVPY